jgi:hypothetical protein
MVECAQFTSDQFLECNRGTRFPALIESVGAGSLPDTLIEPLKRYGINHVWLASDFLSMICENGE